MCLFDCICGEMWVKATMPLTISCRYCGSSNHFSDDCYRSPFIMIAKCNICRSVTHVTNCPMSMAKNKSVPCMWCNSNKHTSQICEKIHQQLDLIENSNIDPHTKWKIEFGFIFVLISMFPQALPTRFTYLEVD